MKTYQKEYIIIAIVSIIVLWIIKPKIILYVDTTQEMAISKTRFIVMWIILTAIFSGIYYYKNKISDIIPTEPTTPSQ